MNNKYDFKQIGKRIREERTNAQNATGRKKVMTQSDLANEIGVSRQTIAKWEHGEIDQLLMGDLLKLCNLFGCELGYILGEYNCRTRISTDIQEETGLSEQAVNFLKEQKLYRCSAIDKIITYDGGIIIRLIYDHLFYKANDVEIEVGNNTTINKKNLADVFLLQIISELRTLRKIISGGSGNGQH